MASRLLRLFLSTVLAGASVAAVAAEPGESPADEQVIQPEVERRDIVIPDIDTEDFEVGLYAGIMSVEDFGSNFVYGARFAYHVTEDIFIEAAYGMTDTGETSFERLSGAAPLLSDDNRQYSYYNASVGINVLPGEAFIGESYAFTSALYVIGGVGTTTFAGEDWFTVNWGFGYRLLATDWLAVHVDARDHMFESDILGEDRLTHNLELHTGLTVFF